MSKLYLGLASAVSIYFALGAIRASAADVNMAEPTSSWTGFYAGVVGGYGWGKSDSDWIGTGSQTGLNGNSFSIDVNGALLGGQVGADYDLGNGLVLGAVADISWSGIDGRDCADISNCPAIPPWPLSYGTYDVNWLSTIRGRLGYGTESFLVYATGGLALADTDLKVTNISGTTPGSDSATLTGFTVGGGLEYKLTQSVSLGAEYLYADFGKQHYHLLDLGGGDTAGVNADLKLHIVRASLNYRF